MIISKTHKFIFFHYPKTAGSTMTYLLAPYCTKSHENRDLQGHGWQIKFHAPPGPMHAGPNAVSNLHHYDDYFKFCVVRNPYDLLVSMWSKKRKEFPNFSTFLSEQGFWPAINETQYNFTHYNGKLLLDHVIKFEDLLGGLKVVSEKTGIDISSVPKLNTSKRTNGYRATYNINDVAWVDKHFGKDLETFDYLF